MSRRRAKTLAAITAKVRDIVAHTPHAANVRVNLRGMVVGMEESFKSFGIGFILSFILLYLILVAQFKSFIDPVLIMLAIPMGVSGVLLILSVHAHDFECHVAHGCSDAGRDRQLEQHSDRRFRSPAGRAGYAGRWTP